MTPDEIYRLLRDIDTCDSTPSFLKCLEALSAWTGIKHISFIWINREAGPWGCSTYPQSWQETYLKNEYALIDPVMIQTHSMIAPYFWDSLDWSRPDVMAFMAEAQRHGVGNLGWTIPGFLRGGQHFSTTFSDKGDPSEWREKISRLAPALKIITLHLEHRASLFFETPVMDGRIKLSPRETQTAILLASGLRQEEIARRIGVSVNTVRGFLKALRLKMNAENNTQAVCRAIQANLIRI